jgi:hypothetical protein
VVPPEVSSRDGPATAPTVSELTLLVSNVRFLTFRPPVSITVGEFVAFLLNVAVSVFVVVLPPATPGTVPVQFPVALQLVLLAPVQATGGVGRAVMSSTPIWALIASPRIEGDAALNSRKS